MRRVTRSVLGAAVLGAVVLVAPAAAAPVGSGTAAAYGARIDVAGQNLVTEPQAQSDLAGADAAETVVDVPVAPLAVSGTLTATAAVHVPSDLPSELLVESQSVAGPYNARGFAEIEGAQVLLDVIGDGVSLLRADAVRAEAVGVCTNGEVQYAARSEIVNLEVGGTDLPLNGPLQDLIDQINQVLEDTGLDQVVDVERNVVTVGADGASVDALRVTVLSAAGAPVGEVVLGHAEVGGVTCGEPPQCSDTVDNDGDGVSDADDPGCHTDGNADNPDSYDPEDDDETDAGRGPACSDGVDNDGDGVIDAADPGCHSDGDATNPSSYDPNDDDEADPAVPAPTRTSPNSQLPRTGGDVPLAVAMAAGLAGLAALGITRRRTAR